MTETKIHASSTNTDLTTFDHWDIPSTQRDIERIVETEHRPISTLSSSSNVEFRFRTAPNEHVNLHKAQLYLRIKIALIPKSDPIAAGDWGEITAANNLLHSIFKNVEVSVGGKETEKKPGTYMYRSVIDNLLGKSNDAKNTHLTSAGWMTESQMTELFKPKEIGNASVSASVELMDKLSVDLAYQAKSIVGNSDIRIVLTPNDPSFYLKIKDNAKFAAASVTFEDASLYVPTSLLHHDFVEFHNDGISRSPLKYFYTATEVRHDTIATGSSHVSFDNICNGQLPRLLILGLVDSEAFTGSFSKDPYEFNHFDMNYACAYVNGHQFPLNAYQMDFDKGMYLRAYKGLCSSINQDGMDSIHNISRFAYPKGKVLLAFNFAQDGSTSMTRTANPIMNGNLRLVIRFKKPVAKALTAFFYCNYDRCLEIDETRAPV